MAQLCSPGRCWQVTVSWQTAQLISPRRKQHRCYHTMASQEAQTIATTVQLQFTLNHSARQACRHCGTALSTSSPEALKRHLAGCKSLPDSVRDVMDHAAVCESRAGMGCYGGVHAALYRGFRVTGWGVNECRRCGKVVRGWGRELRRHISRKSCVARGCPTTPVAPPPPVATATTPGVVHTGSMDLKRRRACARPNIADGSGSAVTMAFSRMHSGSSRPTKRRRPRHADIDNVGNDSDHKAHGNWLRQPSVHLSGGESSISCSNRSTVSRQPREQAPREASGKGMSPDAAASSQARHSGDVATVGPCATVNGGVAWAHGFTVSAGGLKVPLAPMPSRCKRARRVRASGGSVNVWDGGASDCIGTMGSGSGAMVV